MPRLCEKAEKEMINSYVCVDIETTGLNPKTDKIIEVGAVKVIDGKIVEYFEHFVNPGRKLEDRIIELTGICDTDIHNAPQIDEILPDFLKFAENFILLGHGLLFDYSFLKKAAVNQKRTFEKQGIDTLKIARKFLPELESRSLSFLCGYYKIPHNAHRALQDAKATSLLYQRLCEEFYAENTSENFVPKPLIYRVKRETPATKVQKERLVKLLQKHGLSVDYDIEMLTRNEASRYTDQILSRYGR